MPVVARMIADHYGARSSFPARLCGVRKIAMANRLIVQQSAAIARAHSAIERAMETLRGPDGRSDLSC